MTDFVVPTRAETLGPTDATDAVPLRVPSGLILSSIGDGYYISATEKTYRMAYPGLPVGAPHRIAGVVAHFQVQGAGADTVLQSRFRWKSTDYDSGDTFTPAIGSWSYRAEWFPVAPWSARPWKLSDLYDVELGLVNSGADLMTVNAVTLFVVVEPTPYVSFRLDSLGVYDSWDRVPASGVCASGYLDIDYSALANNDQFTLSDGFNAVTFVFRDALDSSVTGDVVLDLSSVSSDNSAAKLIAQAINNSESWPTTETNILATVSGNRVVLNNLHPGQYANVPITVSVAAAGIVASGMQNGTNAASPKYSHVRLDEGTRSYLYPLCASLPDTYLSPEGSTIDKLTYASEVKRYAADLTASAHFGSACAVNGKEAVIGADQQDVGEPGAAYLYVKTDAGDWLEMQKLVMAPLVNLSDFGYAVAMQGDLIVVGAPEDNTFFASGGAALVFERDANLVTYTLTATLVPLDHAANCLFGSSVAINKHREILVGAPGNGVYGVYAFTKSAGTWTQQQKMLGSDTLAADQFGWSLAAHEDTFLVGAAAKAGVGAAYAFLKTSGTWAQQAKLTGDSDAAHFGAAVAIQDDLCVVGDDTDAAVSANGGAASIYSRSGTTWTLEEKIYPHEDPCADYHFGYSVTICQSNYVYVGAYGRTTSRGAVYCFFKAPSGTNWGETKVITASDAADTDRFGYALASDGSNLLVGATQEDDAAANAGAAYFYEDSGYAWGSNCTFKQTLRLEDTSYVLPANLDIDKIQLEVRVKGDGTFRPLIREEQNDCYGEPQTANSSSFQTHRFPYYYRPHFTPEPATWDLDRLRAAEFGLANASDTKWWGHARVDVFASLHTIDSLLVFPTGAGTWDDWTIGEPDSGEARWQDVDDNDNASYLTAEVTTEQLFQTFACVNTDSGQIYGARWMARFRTRSTAKLAPMMIISGSTYIGHPLYFSSWTWTEATQDFWLNPTTGKPWGTTDLQNIEIGFVLLEGQADCAYCAIDAALVPPSISSSEDATWQATLTNRAEDILDRCVAENVIFKVDKFSVGRGGFQFDNPGVVLPVDSSHPYLADEVWSGTVTQADSLGYTAYYWCVIPPDRVGDPLGELMLWGRFISSDNAADITNTYFPLACVHFPADFHTHKKLNVLKIGVTYNVGLAQRFMSEDLTAVETHTAV